MSTESKAKRGASGKTNTAEIPFRGNGLPPDWMARQIGAIHCAGAASSGSKFMRGLVGGMLTEKTFGVGVAGDRNIYDRMIEHAAGRVTSEVLRA